MRSATSSTIPSSYNGDYAAWINDLADTAYTKVTMRSPRGSDKLIAKECYLDIRDNADLNRTDAA